MNEQQGRERQSWLEGILFVQRNNIANILSQLKSVGARASLSLGLHRKFERLMGQVAIEREKELELLHEIEKVEKRHSDLKERRLLRPAHKSASKIDDVMVKMPEPEKPRGWGFWGWVWLAALLSQRNINHKNQGPTVD